MLVELGLVEQRLAVVKEVLDRATVTDVARRYGVVRQTVHECLRRYAHARAGRVDRCVVAAGVVSASDATGGGGADRGGVPSRQASVLSRPGRPAEPPSAAALPPPVAVRRPVGYPPRRDGLAPARHVVGGMGSAVVMLVSFVRVVSVAVVAALYEARMPRTRDGGGLRVKAEDLAAGGVRWLRGSGSPR